jgi:glycosidase
MQIKHFFIRLLLLLPSLNANALPDANVDGIPKVKAWAAARVKAAQKEFGGRYESSPNFWGEQIVYLIQADRFNDGDPSNNEINIEPAQEKGDLNSIFDFHHGGDIEGIIQRLDYLQNLGITTLWITPMVKHSGAFHGYCTTDPTAIDPSFGSNEGYRRLVQEAHARGMYVVMDVVINHMCDRNTFYGKSPNHVKCAADIDQKNWSGQSGGSDAQGELQFSDNFFKPLKSQYFFNRCGANTHSEMEGTGPAAVYGDFVDGMFDFDTRNYDFQEIFTNLYKYWIAYADIDGFRLDAAKHVSEDFIAYFSTETRDYARSIGKDNFYIIGEIAGPSDWIGRRLGKMSLGNVPVTLTHRLADLQSIYQSNREAPYPGLTAVFDFAHGGNAVGVLQNDQPPIGLQNQFNSQYFSDISSQNDPRLNWNLLEIHDWKRFAMKFKKSMEKSILGIAYLAFAEEAPIIYYGQEQGFNSDCHFDSMSVGSARGTIQGKCTGDWFDGLSRQDMFLGGMTRLGSTVPEIDALAYIGLPQSRGRGDNSDPYANTDHQLFRSARTFLNVRKSCDALKYGSTTFRWVEPNSNEGILAFTRNDGRNEVLVVVNTAWSERAVPDMQVDSRTQWKNVLNGFEQANSGDGWARFNGLKIGANNVMVFVPTFNVLDFDPQISAHRCKN